MSTARTPRSMVLDIYAPSERILVRRIAWAAAILFGIGLLVALLLGWMLVAGVCLGAGLVLHAAGRWVTQRLICDLHAHKLTLDAAGRVSAARHLRRRASTKAPEKDAGYSPHPALGGTGGPPARSASAEDELTAAIATWWRGPN